MRPGLAVALAVVFGLVMALSGTAWAAQSAYPYTMNGDSFVRMLHREEPLTVIERERAYSYLDGLKDATQGRLWCDVNHLKTPDLAYDLAYDIARMQPAERQRSAAVLLLDLLNRKYPCPTPARGK